MSFFWGGPTVAPLTTQCTVTAPQEKTFDFIQVTKKSKKGPLNVEMSHVHKQKLDFCGGGQHAQ
jgi:hypothetical protein